MFTPSGSIYLLRKTVDGLSPDKRLLRCKDILSKIHFQETTPSIYETDEDQRVRGLNLIEGTRKNGKDSTIVVPTWKECQHRDFMEAVVANSTTVIVAEEVSAHLPFPENDQIKNDNMLIFLKSIIDVQSRMRESLRASDNDGVHEYNANKKAVAQKTAELMYIEIMKVVEEYQTSNQTKIAEYLTEKGFLSPQKKAIGQGHISKWIDKAGKKDEWDVVKKRFPDGERQKVAERQRKAIEFIHHIFEVIREIAFETKTTNAEVMALELNKRGETFGDMQDFDKDRFSQLVNSRPFQLNKKNDWKDLKKKYPAKRKSG